ncbi:MAG: glycosyltransferase [Acidobacteria bacterium]|nr:glycosyltransferase [Acidobacteriota bacterium]
MARLVVFSHKPCWRSSNSPTGFATDGGFPFQMRALSELFDSTVLVVPCYKISDRKGEIPLSGHNLSVASLTPPIGQGSLQKVGMLWWLVSNGPRLLQAALRADVIHSPIPGDVGTFGIILAIVLRRPLFVRHCGNWEFQRTPAERFWRWFMECFAGGRNVMLATGGTKKPPSERNPAIRWIFSTSLTEKELANCRIERRSIDSRRARLIIVCRQEVYKGTGVLLESLLLLLNDFPNIRQEVVGDGKALTQFKRQAENLGLNGRVHFHGRLDHESVIRLLKQADLFCYPTKSDGFPKVVLEALACGLPVITTPVSVLPQLIGNGCGVVIEEANPEALAQAVRECLSDVEKYRAMSANALVTAERYSLERWRATIGDLLREAGMPLRSDV